MSNQNVVFDAEALHRAERKYRKQLDLQPDDMGTRINLAWCLFMQALHQSGQERVLAELPAARGGSDGATDFTTAVVRDRDARGLLRDCLLQTYTVGHLSLNQEERTHAQKLQALVKLSGGDNTILEASADARRILARISQEIMRPDTAEDA